jgi:hypothetical protein
MAAAIPEWGRHALMWEECGGVLNGVGLPYVYFWRPSNARLQLSPKVATEAKFEPQGFQLLQCSACSGFEYGLYAPSLKRMVFTLGRPVLPALPEWNWALQDVPAKVKDGYMRVRDLRSGEPAPGFEESLRACRVCLEEVIRSIANNATVALQGSNLSSNIDYLKKNMLLEPRLGMIAHEIRRLANPAAHGGKPILVPKSEDTHWFHFEMDSTIAFFHLEALVSHLFLHPMLRIKYDSKPEWAVFFKWVDSVKAGLALA